mgnify:CR=1 FL=1
MNKIKKIGIALGVLALTVGAVFAANKIGEMMPETVESAQEAYDQSTRLDDLAAEAKIITENNKKRDLCGLVRAKIAHGVELKDSSGIEICGLVKK